MVFLDGEIVRDSTLTAINVEAGIGGWSNARVKYMEDMGF